MKMLLLLTSAFLAVQPLYGQSDEQLTGACKTQILPVAEPVHLNMLKDSTGVDNFLATLANAATADGDDNLIFMDVYWLGCSGCQRLINESAPKELLAEIDDQTHSLKIPWRTGKSRSDYKDPVTTTYKLFFSMMKNKVQRFNLNSSGQTKKVEDYRGGDRPHFPQLFFMDARKINRKALHSLCELNNRSRIVGRFSKNLSAEAQRLSNQLITKDGVYAQLVNENIFRSNNADFNSEAVISAWDCIAENKDIPGITQCVQFQRDN
jgi:hypothetical protein